MASKTCTKCETVKPFSEFYKDKRTVTGYRYHCKKCSNDYSAAYVRTDNGRDYILRRKYGITLAEYYALFEAQGGVCALCLNPESQAHSRNKEALPLSVDHCHESGRVRGLLCADCNKMLGLARDNVATLTKAIEYLGGK